MQESRLFKILYHLLDKGQATAPELAEKFEVSVRTIYRDIDALSGAGIPVYTETGRNGGIHLLNDFVLDKTILSETEKQEILAALQSIHITRNMDGSRTLQKLSALFQLHSENWLEVDFSRWGNPGYDNETFELLRSAVIRRRNVKLRYAGSYEEIRERTVQPYKLVYKAKAWYLQAFCTEKQDWRVFKLNRILELEVLEEGFSQLNPPGPIETFEGEYPKVTLRFPKEMSYRVYDEFDASQVTVQEDNTLTVRAWLPEDLWLTGYLLSFGTQVEVIEPAYLKDTLAKQAYQIYQKNSGKT